MTNSPPGRAVQLFEGMTELGLFRMEKRGLKGNSSVCIIPEERVQGGQSQSLFSGAQCRDEVMKHRMFHLKVRKHFFTV